MIGRKFKEEDLKDVTLDVKLKNHIVKDLKTMEENTKIPIDELVAKALQFFIATHNDYLQRNRVP